MAKAYAPSQIKNVAILGHQGSGKTSLLESILFASKKISSKGKVENGNTQSDFTKEEKDAKMSIYSAVCSLEVNNNNVNFIETPGFFDFVGEVIAPLAVASVALVVVRPGNIEVGAKRAYKFIKNNKKPCIVVVNRMDRENSDPNKTFDALNELFGGKCVKVNEPVGNAASLSGVQDVLENNIDELTEKVANCDDEIMMKFLEGEEITAEEVKAGLTTAIQMGELVPVLYTSAEKNIGVTELVNFITSYAPAADTIPEVDATKPAGALVYKTIVDPFQGRISYALVKGGKLTANTDMVNANKQIKVKVGPLGTPNGKDVVPANEVGAGDIAVITKVDQLDTNETVCDASVDAPYAGIKFPQPVVFFGIRVDNKNDEPKVSEGLKRASIEDLTISVERNPEIKQ